jgi:hypothetical protein
MMLSFQTLEFEAPSNLSSDLTEMEDIFETENLDLSWIKLESLDLCGLTN